VNGPEIYCLITAKYQESDYNSLMAAPLIAILTDFGTQDPFVGILKGVIAGLAPTVPTIDLTHEIPLGDIRRAAICLWQSAPFFPAGSIFLVVVDPGVGTSRRPMLLHTNNGPISTNHWFVGPDNGLFTYMLQGNYQAWEINNPAYALLRPSQTFHGRDIFAPTAAYIANGVQGSDFGPALADPVKFTLPKLEHNRSGQMAGEILYSDNYGNLLTSLGRLKRLEEGKIEFLPWLPGPVKASLKSQDFRLKLPDGSLLPLVRTFIDIVPGGCGVLIGSSGLLEIAANLASASDLLGLSSGDMVQLLYHSA
jgi:S-adenosyl-L-methionine hydrolase (adenosine-forming)